jgi:hypothetical protein
MSLFLLELQHSLMYSIFTTLCNSRNRFVIITIYYSYIKYKSYCKYTVSLDIHYVQRVYIDIYLLERFVHYSTYFTLEKCEEHCCYLLPEHLEILLQLFHQQQAHLHTSTASISWIRRISRWSEKEMKNVAFIELVLRRIGSMATARDRKEAPYPTTYNVVTHIWWHY